MLEYKDIALEDRDLFQSFFKVGAYENSEYSFPNLFLWRHSYSIRYSVYKDVLYIIGRYKKQLPFLLPPLAKDEGSSYKEIMLNLIEDCKEKGIPFLMKSVTEPIKEKMEKEMPETFIFEEDPDNYDYVYVTEDLINLKGRKYHSKRNHINKFISQYQYEYETIDANKIDECMVVCMEWFMKKKEDSAELEIPDLEDERAAITEALHRMDELGLKGGLIRVEGRVEAFSLGELLTPQMALVHFEKANPDIPGLYAVINQKFAESEWRNVPFINREEDMGIPGLRKAKQSYHPIRLIKKYNAILR